MARINEQGPAGQTGALAVPAIGGPYYLTVSSDDRTAVPPRTTGRGKTVPPATNSQPANGLVSVYVAGEAKPVTTLPLGDFRLPKVLRNLALEPPVLCRRLFFVPAAQVIAEIPETRNAVVLHRLDLDEKWNRADLEAPVVVSRPPRSVRVGETLRYQIQAISKSGKPAYKLDSGPEGMVLSESGLLQWTPAARPEPGTVGVVISISDSDQSTFHAITLAVQPREEVRAGSQTPATGAVSAGKPADDVHVKLPAAYDDVCAGGGGRYLVCRLDSLQKLGVVDLVAGKIIGYVPVEGKCFFAAGADKLVVLNTEKQVVQRFDLKTQKLEASQPLSNTGPSSVIALGSASHGPVFVGGGLVRLLDLDKLQPIECKTVGQYSVPIAAGNPLRISADGRVLATWRSSGSPSGMQVLVFNGQELAAFYVHASSGWLLPSETGDRIYTTNGIYSNAIVRLDAATPRNVNAGTPIPAVQGPFFLRMIPEQANLEGGPHSGPSAAVYLAGETQPLATVRDLPVLADPTLPAGRLVRDRLTLDKRVYLVPSGKLLALLPETQDSIVIRRFDPEEELQRSGRDYLVVQSVRTGLRRRRPEVRVPSRGESERQQGHVSARLRAGRDDGLRKRPGALGRDDPAAHGRRPGCRQRRGRKSNGAAQFQRAGQDKRRESGDRRTGADARHAGPRIAHSP